MTLALLNDNVRFVKPLRLKTEQTYMTRIVINIWPSYRPYLLICFRFLRGV